MALPTNPDDAKRVMTFWTEEATDEDVAEFFRLIDGTKFRDLYLRDWTGSIADDIRAKAAGFRWDNKTGRYEPTPPALPEATTQP